MPDEHKEEHGSGESHGGGGHKASCHCGGHEGGSHEEHEFGA